MRPKSALFYVDSIQEVAREFVQFVKWKQEYLSSWFLDKAEQSFFLNRTQLDSNGINHGYFLSSNARIDFLTCLPIHVVWSNSSNLTKQKLSSFLSLYFWAGGFFPRKLGNERASERNFQKIISVAGSFQHVICWWSRTLGEKQKPRKESTSR